MFSFLMKSTSAEPLTDSCESSDTIRTDKGLTDEQVVRKEDELRLSRLGYNQVRNIRSSVPLQRIDFEITLILKFASTFFKLRRQKEFSICGPVSV